MRLLTPILISIQKKISVDNQGLRTTVHYQEGYGAIFVPEGKPLHPLNIILAVDDTQLQMMNPFAR